jgi:hypothetical protein
MARFRWFSRMVCRCACGTRSRFDAHFSAMLAQGALGIAIGLDRPDECLKSPLEEPQGGTGGNASDRLTGQPQERQHSDGASRDAGPTAPDTSGRIGHP